MEKGQTHVVTGAFSYSGQYIARRLLDAGQQVKTLTSHPERPDPFGGRVQAMPFHFDNPLALTKSLEGVDTLYNTYWIRFDHKNNTFAQAVANTKTLLRAAVDAGVRRLVHVSITNPALNSSLPYFRGKAELEEAIKESGISYAILRPTIVFGVEDVLINNIAWCVRKFPIFAIPGKGDYSMQPIFAGDLAKLAVEQGEKKENIIRDAAGPERYTFRELVRLVADKTESTVMLVHLSPRRAYRMSRLVGAMVDDVILTKDEVRGLMDNLLISDEPPAGETSLVRWLEANAAQLGTRYASELGRHYR